MYLGGDDTRLFYSYPIEFLKNATFFSWYKISSIGINGPSQYLAPFLLLTAVINYFIPSKVAMNYLALSMPLILGFIYFQKAIRELFKVEKKYFFEVYLGSIFYILSPILMIEQLFVFLISIWLIALIPILIYYFLKYLDTGRFKYVYVSAIWCVILSFALYAVPWIAGFLLPVIIGLLIASTFYSKKQIVSFLKRLLIFAGFILFTQAFWMAGFVSLYLDLGQDSFASKFLSKGFVDTFTPTILSTATGNILYPLLNLFHRQIAFDFEWKLKEVFIQFYDKIYLLNAIYIVVFYVGLMKFRTYLNDRNKKIFIFLLISFIFSLYFYTVNIGPLKNVFLLMGSIPGFTMFRNFFDKFAPGYVMLYSAVISISLIMVSKKFPKKRNIILCSFLLITLLNFIPVKETVNSVLWTTVDLKKTLIIPQEYINFMKKLDTNISPTNNILSVPFGTSAYTVITDDTVRKHVYVGVSPVKIFSGISDISGHYSFGYTPIADVVDNFIIKRDYAKLKNVMYEYNINYIMLTKNVPKALIDSYVFNTDLYKAQDKDFLNAITKKKVIESDNGNYILYEAKKKNNLINSANAMYKRISQVKYKIYVKNLQKKQAIELVDSYHAGWKLFLSKNSSSDFCYERNKKTFREPYECSGDEKLFENEDILYLFKKDIFRTSHSLLDGYANKWTIDPSYVKKNYDSNYYTVNKDGSINIELTMYFVPQTYFYVGTIFTVLLLVAGGIYSVKQKKKNEKTKE